jgi:hypothetical protein
MRTQKLNMDIFNLEILKDVECKNTVRVKISKKFTALANTDDV